MPTYQYECTECGTITEVFQSITESARRKLRKTDDPQCSCGAKVVRLIGTGAGVIFKGSGFYETDYRSESYKKAAEADKKSSEPTKDSKSDGKSADKSDGKSSAKTDNKKADVSPKPKKSKSTN